MGIAIRKLGVFSLALLIIGCGPVSLRQGRRYLSKGEYAQALEALTDALNEDPTNPKIHRDLGIAYYKNGQYEQAIDELKKAKQRLKKDSHVVFYLGLTYEQLELYDEAIAEYANYTQLRRFSRMRRQIQQRIQWLIRQQADQWAKERMKMEKEIDVASIPDNTIAVTYFKPFQVSKDLEPLHKGLTDLLIIDLSLVKSLKVVERMKLKEIYDELGLSSTDLVDQSTAPRMGKLLGANSLVTGIFTGLPGEQWRIDPTLGLVKLGEFQALESVEGQLRRFLQVEKRLVLQTLDSLNIELTQEERDSIQENVPTESLQAFLAYSKGLDYTDRGMYPEAAREFENAISLDPKFNQAKEHLTGAKLLSQSVESTDELEVTWDSVLSSEEVRDELLTTTVESVSQGDVSRTPGSEPKPPEEEREVQLKVLIQW